MESAAVSAFLNSVMGRLFLLLEKEYHKHRGLAQEAQSIQLELSMIAANMDDQIRALGRHERTAIARLYGAEILDLEHDIEDCVDRFTHRLKCKQHGGSGAASSLVRRMAHELKKVQSRSSYADEIHKLKRRLKEARQRVIDSVPVGQPNGLLSMMLDTSKPCRAITSHPVGIEKPMKEILSLLHEVDGEPQQLRVISIVGFGGLGKTTLARAVYDSPRAKETFHCRARVSATDTSPEIGQRIKVILRDILQQVVPKDSMDLDVDNNLEASLKEYLSDKRYLIVIDDVQMDEWRAVNSAFVDSNTGSRIILTTTIQSVANMCSHGNGYVYQMDTLGEEDSKKIAFLGISRSPELEHRSAGLLGKCDGLPLALASVSDYLKSSNERTGEFCAKLCSNLGSHLKEKHGRDIDNFSDLRKVLLDNYYSFPGYALSCFLYLGIFPSNRPLKRKVVIRRWLAEGYARSESLRDEQDIADENFKKLIDWNIIRPIDTRNNSEVKTCKTHGIMHEFVLHKSLSHRFIMTLPPDHPRVGANAKSARHLSVHDGKLTECGASDVDLSCVRSLTVFGDAGGAISYIRKCKLIRVLDLEGCNDLRDDDLEHICKLWYLKYLSLGDTIHELPRCIDGLHCLETLDLRRTKIKSLPVEAIQLPHLTHLFGKLMFDKDDLKKKKKMSKLEKFLSGKKSNLQTLAGFVADNSKGFLQFIMHMDKLRKVKIWCKRVANGDSYMRDLSKAIQKLTKVPMDRHNDCSLSLDFEETCEDFLSSLKLEPCSEGSEYDLRSLKLHGKLLLLPPFVTQLRVLTDLCISSATLSRGLLSALANLDKLLYLKLIADLLESFEIKHGAFPSLQRLCFQVKSLAVASPTIEQGARTTIEQEARTTIEQGALPNLVSLQLLCPDLVVGLSGIDIRHFKHLKEVTIDAEAAAETRQHWVHAAKNHPNRPRVIESEELGPCAIREKRKRCPAQPSLEGLDSSLKKVRLSESSSWSQAIVRPIMGTDTMASSSNPIPLHADESGGWMQQPSHP
ncbi:Disease resistance protein RPM1 [Dichanthelium oligosanthes]|uniref:Disease resistance protein RPM1 n=1 Tax=Dichanthelium oligosanthes TaxID=888268 RepID=A0A1E5WBC9_9POAL|nr:Disease resistance protein RPM1 [Dichanthelium oligosanthes]